MTVTARALLEASDAEIVDLVNAGAREVFEVLVRRHNQRLFRAARAILRSDTEAEDVLQQAWLDIYRNLGQFRGDAQFTTWATRICVHAAIAHARKRPVIAEVEDAPGGDAPDAALEAAQLGALLEASLAQLPQGHREVMVLRDVLELDTAETAACLGLSQEAVRVRLHRARAAVAAALAETMIDKVYAFDGDRCDRMTRNVMASIML
ncbi:MAG TPA: sigma-70 family RNA polymerase sigma factor [Kofleriaceae bacterium]|nr:sigma-70 family RNA polymerase sigma factor [Kofleriaceae bacterium]